MSDNEQVPAHVLAAIQSLNGIKEIAREMRDQNAKPPSDYDLRRIAMGFIAKHMLKPAIIRPDEFMAFVEEVYSFMATGIMNDAGAVEPDEDDEEEVDTEE